MDRSRLVHGGPLLQLAQQAGGLAQDQWCYLPADGGYDDGMTIPADVFKRTGYRLPTEAEWEYACRSGTVTSRYYRRSTELLGLYARYPANSQEQPGACGSLLPNDLGLFDMLGNAYEWVHDRLPVTMDPAARWPGRHGMFNDMSATNEVVSGKTFRLPAGGAYGTQPAPSAPRSVATALRCAITPATVSVPPGLGVDERCGMCERLSSDRDGKSQDHEDQGVDLTPLGPAMPPTGLAFSIRSSIRWGGRDRHADQAVRGTRNGESVYFPAWPRSGNLSSNNLRLVPGSVTMPRLRRPNARDSPSRILPQPSRVAVEPLRQNSFVGQRQFASRWYAV